MPTFNEVYNELVKKGPARIISSRGTEYRVEVRDNNIVAFPRSGRVVIHEDCWGMAVTCQGTRAGGVYNGSYSIYNWYIDNT